MRLIILMSFSTYIDPDANCLFVRHYGSFDLGEVLESLEENLSNPIFRIDMNVLRDYRDQTFPSDLTFKLLSGTSKSIMEDFDRKFGKCKAAIVVGDTTSYAKVHQYIVSTRLMVTQIERRLFREIEEAKEWLEIPEDYVVSYPD